MKNLNLVFIGLICIVLISLTPGVNALSSYSLGKLVTGGVYTNSPNLITVDLSSECLALVKHNETSVCPTYKKLFPYDNSNQVISGKFVYTNGFFHRLQTKTVNHWGMYPPGKWIVMIDPDYRAIVHSKEIKIVSSLTYINKDESVGSDHIRNEYQQRYVYPGCSGAEIVYSDFLFDDTIKYLESGCTTTSFKEKVSKETPHNTPSVFNSQYSSLPYQANLKTIFHGVSQLHNEKMPIPGGLGPGNCINTDKCTITTSNKKPGY